MHVIMIGQQTRFNLLGQQVLHAIMVCAIVHAHVHRAILFLHLPAERLAEHAIVVVSTQQTCRNWQHSSCAAWLSELVVRMPPQRCRRSSSTARAAAALMVALEGASLQLAIIASCRAIHCSAHTCIPLISTCAAQPATAGMQTTLLCMR
jgi:2-polyprenyl-3-methyl-5-hydroxy-6-metoxy-1,4-benzoquinol methylase